MTNAFAPTPAPAVDAVCRGRRAVRRAAAVAAVGLLSTWAAGCGGAGQSQSPPPPRPAVTFEQPPADAAAPADDDTGPTPATGPITQVVPPAPELGSTTAPATLPAAATGPAGADEAADLPPIPSATQPATLPAAEAGVGGTPPATAPSTAPTTAEAAGPAAAAEREPDLLLVEQATPAGRALAEIFETFGEGTLLDADGSPDLAAQGEALLTAAARLAPDDARLARALVEARLRIGDVPGGLEALTHYRALKPNDTLAQIRYVDLAGDGMQTAGEKIDYLSGVAESDRVADDVRSHAAAMAALVAREALDDAGADDLIRRAVELDPYSPLALQLDYERLLASGAGRADRVAALAALARSNPVQPAVLTRLGEESLAAGLGEPANTYYSAAMRAYTALGLTPPTAALVDAAATQIVTNRPRDAAQTANLALRTARQDLAANGATPRQAQAAPPPGVVGDAALLNLLANGGAAAGDAGAGDQARDVIRRALADYDALLNDRPPAAPAPADQPPPPAALPDVVADAQKLAAGDLPAERRSWRGTYAVLLSDLAWADLYFAQKPADEAVLRALDVLVPEGSATLVRLRGWQLWRQGQDDAAAEKLQTVSDRDPLARLGLLLMGRPAASEPADAAEAASPARQMQELLDAAPNGLVGAFLADALRGRGILLQPADDAEAVRQALAVLEPRLLDVLQPENVGRFYSLDARPATVSHEFGEPLLMTVTLRNKGRDVVTVGPDGLVESRFRLDARVGGGLGQPQSVPASAEPEWTGGTLLRPGEKLEQVVRLDGPQLSGFLASLPQQRLTINADVTSNPVRVQTPQGPGYATGPAGQTVAAGRLLDRQGVPLDLSDKQVAAALNDRVAQLRSSDPLERLRAAQLVLAEIRWVAGYVDQQKQAGAGDAALADLRQLGTQMFDALQRAAGAVGVPQGRDAAATAWLKYAAAVVADPDKRGDYLRQLLASPAFESRAVGLLASATLVRDAAQAQALVAPLAEGDADPTVRRLARSQLRYLRARPTTAPAPAPATP